MLGSARQKDVESPIPGPSRLVVDQLHRFAADLIGAAHELEKHAQPHPLGGTAHTRGNVDDAECLRALSVPDV
jgi:hypothetical protein